MGFLRPKSRGKDAEPEPRKRNRLSKPMTSRSTTNLKATAKEQSDSPVDMMVPSPISPESLYINTNKDDSRERVRSHLFGDQDGHETASLKTNTLQVKSGVAQLVAQYETASPSSSRSSLNEQVKKRPQSATISRFSQAAPQQHSRPSPTTATTTYRSLSRGADSPIEDQMWDKLQQRYAVPTRRRSNFIPGEATRKPSIENSSPSRSIDDGAQPEALERDSENGNKERDYHQDDDAVSETWTAPVYPTHSRPDTPKSFERKALGNLSLGSLHITNGRASPNMSEMSIPPKSQTDSSRLRDVSSEYADSEAWEDDAVMEDESETGSTGRKTPTNDLKRNFSFAQGTEERLTARPATASSELAQTTPPRTPIPKSPDTASLLAEEYMAELPPSPFAARATTSSPASTGSVVHHDIIPDYEDHTSGRINPPAVISSSQKNRAVSNESKLSSADSQPSFAGSHLSSSDSPYAREDVFQSALEFQHFSNPGSPERAMAPFMMTEFEQSDSGYSSMNSIRSAQAIEEGIKIPVLDAVPEQSIATPNKQNSPRKLGGFLPLRPAIKSRNTAPVVPVSLGTWSEAHQSSKTVPVMTDLQASPVQPKKDEKDSPKPRKKLQKLKPLEKFIIRAPPPPEEVVVQRNPSAETYSVPLVPAHTAASLDLRVQQLPELERTVRNHNKSSSSTSTLAVPQDIRFPTPNPEPDEDERRSRKSKDRSKSRTRSKSRRRSMLEFFTGSKDEKRRSGIVQPEHNMNIDDLGDVVAALGTNPYDIAIPPSRSRSQSRDWSGNYDTRLHPRGMERQFARDITPHRLSYPASTQRFMMDDQTASEYARNRSRSIHERDNWSQQPVEFASSNTPKSQPRRTSFNDRGGIPGKNLRSPRQSEEAPPMPPMPSPAEIRRMSGRYDEYQPVDRSQDSGALFWPKDSSPEPEYFDPPPPPPHSPRPAFLEHQPNDFEEPEDFSSAPPPPCHSPRPMDIEPEPASMSADAWADHARAWRARRQSAGETLRARWSSAQYHDNQYTNDNDTYPSIPPRPRTEYFDGSEHWSSPAQHDDYTWTKQNYDDHYQDESRYHQYHGDENYSYHSTDNHSGRPRNSRYHSSSYHEDAYHPDPFQREPSPAPSRPLPSRPGSRVSYRSTNSAVSLAEELHPEISGRPSPAPSYGRYSGGLQFSYEGKNKGFGGSSGTRSVSGKADAQWKGMALKQTFGVDLGDVPIMGVVKPLR